MEEKKEKTLEDIIDELPENIRFTIYRAFKKFEESIIQRGLEEIKEEQRRVWEAIRELAEAQRRTEKRVENLEEEIKKVWEVIRELAEAQKRAEKRIENLEEEQRKTREVIRELAEAQRRTEKELQFLIQEHRKTREQLGGLTHTFGYTLEDRAIKSLPKILNKYGFEVGKLKRTFVQIDNQYIELNIYGRVKKNGEEYLILGEAKSKITRKAIDSFLKKCNIVSKHEGYENKIVKILISYIFTPDIENYANQKGIILIPSFELEL